MGNDSGDGRGGGRGRGKGENRAMERRVRRISEEQFGRGGRRGLNTPYRPLGRAGDKPPLWIPSVNGGVIASSTTEYGWRV